MRTLTQETRKLTRDILTRGRATGQAGHTTSMKIYMMTHTAAAATARRLEEKHAGFDAQGRPKADYYLISLEEARQAERDWQGETWEEAEERRQHNEAKEEKREREQLLNDTADELARRLGRQPTWNELTDELLD